MTTIFMVGLSIFSFVQIKRLYNSSHLIHQTNQVQNVLQEISNYMLEAESKKRGYLLTADSVFLNEKDEALYKLEQSQYKLDSLISGNADQMAYASLLRKAIDENKKSIKEAGIPQSQWNTPDHMKVSIHEELQRIDNVNTFLEKMTREESALLEHHKEQHTQLSLIAPFYIIVLFLGALLILFFSYFTLNAELVKSHNLHSSLVIQGVDRETLAGNLIIANQELAYQNKEKEKRAHELAEANMELEFQNETKEKLAGEFIIANQELAFQNEEKEKRASELAIANLELEYQNSTKEKLAAELIIANQELAYQNEEKEKRASELAVANQELSFQNEEKGKRASELAVANLELSFQNEEKGKRASELVVANLELESQNGTKEKLAAELILANKELAFQNEEKEKRAAELVTANKELQLFLNISSHDLQEPLRKIQMAASRIDASDYKAMSPKGQVYLVKMKEAAMSMQTLIEDLLTYSQANSEQRRFECVDLGIIIDEVRNDLKESIQEKRAVFEMTVNCKAYIIRFQFRQLMFNIISNALKFSIPGQPPFIKITADIKHGSVCKNKRVKQDQEYCHIQITDNGIGFEPQYSEQIFEVFQRLYDKETYKGTGIGLAIVKRIVENHDGCITATGELNKGATFDIYIPTIKKPKHG